MGAKTNIEWTQGDDGTAGATWNPVTGCTKVSAGCDNCYAERFSERWRGTSGNYFENGFDLTLRPNKLNEPLKWKRPRKIFVNSMSDLFHKDIPRSYVDSVFDVMERADWNTYQVLTKRSSLMGRYVNARYRLKLPPAQIWLGVSVEDKRATVRIRHLQETKAAVRFLSIEPLIGPVGYIDLDGIDWVIVGGESGPNARPMAAEWVRDIRDQCILAEVPFFFKQWGGARPKSGGKVLDGKEWCQFPKPTNQGSLNV